MRIIAPYRFDRKMICVPVMPGISVMTHAVTNICGSPADLAVDTNEAPKVHRVR